MASILEILLKAKGGEQVKTEMGKADKAAKQSSKTFAALGAMLSVGILAKGIKDSIAAYKVQELAVTKLNSALKAQGVFTEDLSQKLQDQASALQEVTIFGDEAILSAQAFGMSMGMNSDTVSKITPIILDFASAMGIDLMTAFRVVGQAAAGDTGMLKRYGIIVDETALKNEGFNAVLATMQKNFRGTAAEIAKSGIGPMEQFSNTMGDFQEDVGRGVIPILNTLIKTFMKFGGSLQNKAIEERASIEKRVTKILQDQNTSEQDRVQLMRAVRDQNQKMIEGIVERAEKEKEAQEIRVEQSEAWKKRLAKEAEKERNIFKKGVEKREKGIIDEYNLRRELRELDLKDVIQSIEDRIEAEEEGSEERMALEQSLADFKKALNIETAADIAAIQDSITDSFQSNLTDMILSQKSFQEGTADIWESIKRVIIDTIVKTVLEERAAAVMRIAAEQAVAAAKAISAYAGVPVVGLVLGIAAAAAVAGEINKYRGSFGGGGTVPGPEGQPGIAVVHGGEEIKTPAQQRAEKSPSLVIHIHGQFLEADETKWSQMFRKKIYPEMQRMLKKTGEQFSGG